MSEYISKSAVIDKLTALENVFQQFKPFEGFEHAMYRKLCEVEMEIGKMPGMNFVTDTNVGHWIIHSEVGGRKSFARTWAECSECHVCGSPQWKVCPVCEARMVE